MPIDYVNRKGVRYFLHEGKTKTGKPKFYAAKTAEGQCPDKMPDGYEFYEHPEQAIVSVRKIPTTQILPQEREALAAWVQEFGGVPSSIVDIQNDSLVVYVSESRSSHTAGLLSRIMPLSPGQSAMATELFANHSVFTAMLRFTLIDEEKRLFAVDRWCFRGSIDDWFPLAAGKNLETQARKFLPHLGKESFYELM